MVVDGEVKICYDVQLFKKQGERRNSHYGRLVPSFPDKGFFHHRREKGECHVLHGHPGSKPRYPSDPVRNAARSKAAVGDVRQGDPDPLG